MPKALDTPTSLAVARNVMLVYGEDILFYAIKFVYSDSKTCFCTYILIDTRTFTKLNKDIA